MSALRFAAPLAAVALGVAGLGTASSATAATSTAAQPPSDRLSSPVCLLRVQKVRVKDLQHDALGTDRVFAMIGGSVTTTRPYTLPQTRNTLGDGEELFLGSTLLRLRVEVGGFDVPVGSAVLPCQDANPKFTFDNGDARYKVKALVQVQP